MTDKELDMLINRGEDEKTEFKGELNLSSKWHKAEFLKDMLALVNAHGEGSRYIILGVQSDGSRTGLTSALPDDAHLQQLVSETIDAPIQFSLHTHVLEGVTFGVIEVKESPSRFHLVKRDYEYEDNNKKPCRLAKGMTWIRRGSGKAPLSAWDFLNLREHWLRQHHHSPKPVLNLCFEDGSEATSVRAKWSSNGTGLSALLDRLAVPNPVMPPPKPDGCASLPFRVENIGTTQATSIHIVIDLPEGCTMHETPLLAVPRSDNQDRIYYKKVKNQISIVISTLNHYMSRGKQVEVVFPIPQEYELRWSAFAGNMVEPCSGLLKVIVA